MTTEHFILLAAMVCLIVVPTLIVHLMHRRAESRRAAQRCDLEEPFPKGQRRRRGRIRDDAGDAA